MSVTIKNSTFQGESAAIREYHEYHDYSQSIDFGKIEKELQNAKSSLDPQTPDYQVVEELEFAAKKRDWKRIAASAAKHAGTVLANLTGGYLESLLNK